jgi:hypothetical protein
MPFRLGELINYVNRSDNLTNLRVVVVAISNQKHRDFRAVRCPCIILKSRAYNVHNNTRHLKLTCITNNLSIPYETWHWFLNSSYRRKRRRYKKAELTFRYLICKSLKVLFKHSISIKYFSTTFLTIPCTWRGLSVSKCYTSNFW